MVMQVALVRADQGQPLERVVVERAEQVVYVVRPDRVEAMRLGESAAVGFPSEDVFDFDPGLYARLRQQWDLTGCTSQGLWKEARPAFPLPPSRA